MSSHHTGQRISYDGALCTIRYIGEVAGANGLWLGVEWDDATRGKHDGSHKGVRYFTCLSKAPTVASFVRPSRPAEAGQSFVAALKQKYVGKEDELQGPQIVISGNKVAEEMGFDKVRRQMAQLHELKVAILDGSRIDATYVAGDSDIHDTCPKISQLDLSRNLFQKIEPVIEICSKLPGLRKLAINGNRFQDIVTDHGLQGAQSSLLAITELAMGDTLMSWEEICLVATKFASLASLTVGTNQLSNLPFFDMSTLSSTLTTINFEYNDFTTLSDLGALVQLQSLRNLLLKGNNINALAAEGCTSPVFPDSLQYLDISYNNIDSWCFVDSLTTHIPGLTALRLAHNPIFSSQTSETKAITSEEAHMFTIARMAQLKTLNFSTITTADRTNAEVFYISRIAKQLATIPEAAEKSVTSQHPRYAELCEIHGAPDIIRRQEVNPAFLEARLINIEFILGDHENKIKRIPQAFDIYTVKSIAARLFGLSPLALKLVWETGEWDPVTDFDKDTGEISDEEEEEEEQQNESTEPENATEHAPSSEGKAGRWLRREVELKDGPRQLGYCVDGMDVKIRIELIA